MERFAEALVCRDLDAHVVGRDDGSRGRMVDSLLRLPDGRTVALEVTRLADRAGMELKAGFAATSAKLKSALERVESERAWRVVVSGPCRLKSVQRHLPAVIEECIRAGVENPNVLPDPIWDTPPFRWLAAHPVRVAAWAPHKRCPPGSVVLVEPPLSGFVESIEGLPSWLSSRLTQTDLTRKIAKLTDADCDQRHLFLCVEESGSSFGIWDRLACSEDVPAGCPELPAVLDCVWLATRFQSAKLLWSRSRGWARVPLDQAVGTTPRTEDLLAAMFRRA